MLCPSITMLLKFLTRPYIHVYSPYIYSPYITPLYIDIFLETCYYTCSVLSCTGGVTTAKCSVLRNRILLQRLKNLTAHTLS